MGYEISLGADTDYIEISQMCVQQAVFISVFLPTKLEMGSGLLVPAFYYCGINIVKLTRRAG